MDRFGIALGAKPKPVKPKPKAKRKAKTYEIPKTVKEVTDIFEMEDDHYEVKFQVSPRSSKCYKCNKRIPKNTPRYKVCTRNGSWRTTETFHQKCLSADMKKWIKRYPGRNVDRERLDRTLQGLIWRYGEEYVLKRAMRLCR